MFTKEKIERLIIAASIGALVASLMFLIVFHEVFA